MNDNKMTSDSMDDWGCVTTSVQFKRSMSVSTEIVPRDGERACEQQEKLRE